MSWTPYGYTYSATRPPQKNFLSHDDGSFLDAPDWAYLDETLSLVSCTGGEDGFCYAWSAFVDDSCLACGSAGGSIFSSY